MNRSIPHQGIPMITGADTEHLPGAVIDEQNRPEPPVSADEWHTLTGFLDFQRATLHWKCSGLTAADLQHKVAASQMTLGGILKHMAWVEERWFSRSLLGIDMPEFWAEVDWRAEPDWEWTSAAADSPLELFTLWQDAVHHSRQSAQQVHRADGLSLIAARGWPDGTAPSLRWILVHMIEEYARHNGHADLFREAIDGATGE